MDRRPRIVLTLGPAASQLLTSRPTLTILTLWITIDLALATKTTATLAPAMLSEAHRLLHVLLDSLGTPNARVL